MDLRTHARVIRIEQGGRPGDRRRACTGAALPAAEIVILAANGVGTPRLLLASGLANSSDQVGRNLLHHTLVACEMWVDEPWLAHRLRGGPDQPRVRRDRRQPRLRQRLQLQLCDHGRCRRAGERLSSNARAPWGRDHHKWFARHFGRGFGVFGIGDDLPNPENRITLSDTERDEDGCRWRGCTICPARTTADDALHARPAGRDRQGGRRFEYRLQDYTDEKVSHRRRPAPARHLPDGQEPEMSVVNKHHQCWDVPNLFIIDGSVFTTGGVVTRRPP